VSRGPLQDQPASGSAVETSAMLRVSIVIPTLNEERYVGSVLSDIARQTRKADEVIVVDGKSQDATASVVERFSGVDLLVGAPPVAYQRNLGGRKASGDILVFLDADVRLSESFLEEFLERIERRNLDIACPLYMPYRSTLLITSIHVFVNVIFVALQKALPSGAGHCIAIRRELFQKSRGFDPNLKVGEDVALVRKLSRGHRFGVVTKQLFVSDRRYKEEGVSRMLMKILLLSIIFSLGKFGWANRIEHDFGSHTR
jgi:glycosyltransferase involved in cell wall biosynthesis